MAKEEGKELLKERIRNEVSLKARNKPNLLWYFWTTNLKYNTKMAEFDIDCFGNQLEDNIGYEIATLFDDLYLKSDFYDFRKFVLNLPEEIAIDLICDSKISYKKIVELGVFVSSSKLEKKLKDFDPDDVEGMKKIVFAYLCQLSNEYMYAGDIPMEYFLQEYFKYSTSPDAKFLSKLFDRNFDPVKFSSWIHTSILRSLR